MLTGLMSDFPKLHRLKADDENMEKIHIAARNGRTEEVQRLIEIGIDPNIPNRFGCIALHLACKFGQVETAKFLAGISDGNGLWHGQKPLHLAVLANKVDLVRAMVDGARERGRSVESMLNDCDEMVVTQIGENFKECKGQTALHWCVGLGADYLPMLKLLVELGASPTAKDKDNQTPLMRAIEFGNDEAMSAMLENATSSSLRLDYADKNGWSHLHWAILYNHEDYALTFLELKHDMNMEDNEHVVPLYLAIRAAMVPLTRILVEGCDPFLVQNAPFHNGTTVLQDRVKWLPFVEEGPATVAAKQEVLQLLQTKLSEMVAALKGDGTRRKRKKSVKRISLAPSAPIRKNSRRRSKSATKK